MIRLFLAIAVGGAAYYLYRQKKILDAPGSTTNASDAVDDIKLRGNATTDEKLDAGVMETFPASDPVSTKPSETAYERQQRMKRSGKTL